MLVQANFHRIWIKTLQNGKKYDKIAVLQK